MYIMDPRPARTGSPVGSDWMDWREGTGSLLFHFEIFFGLGTFEQHQFFLEIFDISLQFHIFHHQFVQGDGKAGILVGDRLDPFLQFFNEYTHLIRVHAVSPLVPPGSRL
jgi:hypothetical protein